ncbi:MAG: PAS domain-containing protein [Bauldia sp.]|nr:PAS domain-containing protein [Bauldia sp.]
MKHPSCRELYRYWDRLRSGLPAPRRTAIEPSDIRTILADTFILEVGERRSYRFRLAGTRLCGILGRELKGSEFLDLWSGEDRAQVAGLLGAVTGEAAAASLGVSAAARSDRHLAMEMVLLPLIQNGPGYDRILGALAPGELPYWLGLDPVSDLSVGSTRLIWPDRDDPFPIALTPQPHIVSAFAPERRRGRFVVVEGGKSGL